MHCTGRLHPKDELDARWGRFLPYVWYIEKHVSFGYNQLGPMIT